MPLNRLTGGGVSSIFLKKQDEQSRDTDIAEEGILFFLIAACEGSIGTISRQLSDKINNKLYNNYIWKKKKSQRESPPPSKKRLKTHAKKEQIQYLKYSLSNS